MALVYTNQTSKKKKNLTAKQRELTASWEAIKAKYEPKKVLKNNYNNTLVNNLYIPKDRDNRQHKSLNSGYHDTSKKDSPIYTGNAIIGIGTLHKSNAVPVFSKEEASDIAKMRRG